MFSFMCLFLVLYTSIARRRSEPQGAHTLQKSAQNPIQFTSQEKILTALAPSPEESSSFSSLTDVSTPFAFHVQTCTLKISFSFATGISSQTEWTQMCHHLWITELSAPCATHWRSTTFLVHTLLVLYPQWLFLWLQVILMRSRNLSVHPGVPFPTWLPKKADILTHEHACLCARHHNFRALWSILNKFNELKEIFSKLYGNEQSGRGNQIYKCL